MRSSQSMGDELATFKTSIDVITKVYWLDSEDIVGYLTKVEEGLNKNRIRFSYNLGRLHRQPSCC